MKFIDEITVRVESGAGGDGCVAWRREPYVPRGGPAGGNGGPGGNVVLVADEGRRTLLELRYKRHLRAKRGGAGGGKRKTGARGSSVVIQVPIGTIVTEVESGEILADLSQDGAQCVVATGGEGGRGNANFASSTRRAPDAATSGHPGETRELRLELKLLADVGVVGLPNAGKSTFISRVSNARPKIADYPFTTLVPNLGVVERSDIDPFVLADIPGLVEGAHSGVGLGHRFLRHIERTSVLLYLLDHDPEVGCSAVEAFETLHNELLLYDRQLAERPGIIALNKMDLLHAPAVQDAVRAVAVEHGMEFFACSAVSGDQLDQLLRALGSLVTTSRADAAEEG